MNDSSRRLVAVSLDTYPRQPFRSETCIWCRMDAAKPEYGIPFCRLCGLKFADRIEAVEGRRQSRKRRAPTTVNRHGVPLRGREPGPCIWPKCPEPRYRPFDTKLCWEHARHVWRSVDANEKRTSEAIKKQVTEAFDRWRSEQPPEPEPESKPCVEMIYYLQVVSHIKIGWTRDLSKRMKGYPPNSVLLATEPGGRADEQRIHKMFAVHRTHGSEWYAPVPSILHHIEMVKKKHRTPAGLVVGANPVSIPEPREKQYIGGPRLADWGKSRVMRG